MQPEHLDHALEQEFAGHAEAIHKLKVSDPAFAALLELNHRIWREIQNIKHDVIPASDEYRRSLEKQRLTILDDIAKMIAASEA